MAFTQNINPTFPKQPQNTKAQITNTVNLADVTVVTTGVNGSKLIGLIASNTDTNPYNIQVKITNSSVDYIIETKAVPASAGNTAGVPAVNMLDPTLIVGIPVDSDGNPFLFLGANDTLTVASLTQVTSGKVINLIAVYSDF